MSDYDNIRNALTYIDPHDRDIWLRMGAAVKDELGEDGFELWDNWSRQADTYKSNDAKSVWKSLKQGRIHIGTLFYHARENGYKPEKPYTPPSAEELAKRAQEAQEKQRAEAERMAQAHAKAAKVAYGIWKNATPANLSHAYAQSKGLNEAAISGIRQNEYNGKNQLIIPLYADKKLVNVQTIDEDGNKKFLNGGQKQGAYTVIGDFKQHQQGIILAEGFATAASVYQATGKPVIVAFDAGNLKAVSEKLLNELPGNTPIYFAADNDPSHTGEHKAQAAAEVWGERAKIILPEFNQAQIQQYQQVKGADKMPTDFNDLHQLAGIEAVRETFNMLVEPEIQPSMTNQIPTHTKPELSREELMKNNYWRMQNGYEPLPEPSQARQPENQEHQEIRTAWGDFPPVVSNGKLGELKNEPEYSAAKAGDVEQSALLVEKLLKDETVQEIKDLIGDSKPILVPVQSVEASGKNRIPQATAFALAEKLGLQVDESIYQSNTVKRTDTGIYHRYVAPPEFKGEVQAGKSYLIVDDTFSVGGTIATLKGYIENNGGKVIGSTVMTAHALKVDIPILPNMLQSLQQKQGLNEYWKQEFGYGVDKLTQQEAGHLRKPTLEQIQERVQEARQNLHLSQNKELNHEQTTQSIETQQRPVHPTPEIDRTGISRTETVWTGEREVSQGVFQSQETSEPTISETKLTTTSERDVVVSFSETESVMENQKQNNLPTHELPNYSHDNPYAQWAANDDEVRQNADDWEARQPLTDSRLAEFNTMAEQQGFTTYIEPQHGNLGVFQANKYADNMDYRVEILGEFKNHGGQSIYEAARDFTVSFYEKENVVDYLYTNDLNMALQKSSEWLKTHELRNENTIEYGGTEQELPQVETISLDEVQANLQRMRSAETILQDNFRQPETGETQQSETEIKQPESVFNSPIEPTSEQERKANIGLDYEIPEHLKSRMVAVDTQRFRVANYEMGGHLLRYVAPDNNKTVLFEDKGKSIHTARDDQQTIKDMLAIAQAKNWDSIKISGNQEFKQQMWLEAESRGIATSGYKPSPEDLALLEQRRAERATNSIAEAEKLKQQSAVPEKDGSNQKTIPSEAIKAADTVKAHAHKAQQSTPKPSDTAKAKYETKLATLPPAQQQKARFYERQALAAMRHMPAEFHEKTRQAIYENQTDLIRDGKYHAPDPMKTAEKQHDKDHEIKQRTNSRDNDIEMER